MDLNIGDEVVHTVRNIYGAELARHRTREGNRPEYFQMLCKIINPGGMTETSRVQVEFKNGIQKWVKRDSISFK